MNQGVVMDIKTIVKDIGSKFKYYPDVFKLFDWWYVMPERNGVMCGDCEDFSITAIWQLCNRNIATFIWRVIILHQYRIYFGITKNNEFHAMGYAQGLWFDNWTREAMPKDQFLNETGHRVYWFVPGPLILFNMFLGAFVRNLKR